MAAADDPRAEAQGTDDHCSLGTIVAICLVASIAVSVLLEVIMVVFGCRGPVNELEGWIATISSWRPRSVSLPIRSH